MIRFAVFVGGPFLARPVAPGMALLHEAGTL